MARCPRVNDGEEALSEAMRRLWSRNPKEIEEVLDALANLHVPVSLQLVGGYCLRSVVVGIHVHHELPYLLLQRPAALNSGEAVTAILFKIGGVPILGFSGQVSRETSQLLALDYPRELFQLELRKNERINPLPGSMATFFIQNRARVSICHMENISMGGAKLVGNPTHMLAVNDLIGPCTLSLAGRDALIAREVTINRAQVIRVNEDDGKVGQLGLGLKFDLAPHEERFLREHIDFLKGQ